MNPFVRITPELLAEARHWHYQIQTCESLERVWPAFDAWLETSAAHRAAYAHVHRRWRQLTGLEARWRVTKDHLILIGLLVLLALIGSQ